MSMQWTMIWWFLLSFGFDMIETNVVSGILAIMDLFGSGIQQMWKVKTVDGNIQ